MFSRAAGHALAHTQNERHGVALGRLFQHHRGPVGVDDHILGDGPQRAANRALHPHQQGDRPQHVHPLVSHHAQADVGEIPGQGTAVQQIAKAKVVDQHLGPAQDLGLDAHLAHDRGQLRVPLGGNLCKPRQLARPRVVARHGALLPADAHLNYPTAGPGTGQRGRSRPNPLATRAQTTQPAGLFAAPADQGERHAD